MKAKINGSMFSRLTNKTTIEIEVDGDQRKLGEIEEAEVTIKKYSAKRSLDANNYAWLLFNEIAKKVKSTKEEVYVVLLKRYGTFFYLPCEEDKVAELEQVFRIVIDRGETTLTTPSGKEVVCRQLQCYKGSSLMNIQEMSDFLDGVVSEAEQLGIDTMTPEERRKMMERYGTQINSTK